MDCNNSDLETFESKNLCAIIWAGELGKNAALVSNHRQNASDPQQVEEASNYSQHNSQCQAASCIWFDSDNSLAILKHQLNVSWKDIVTLLPPNS